jgi:DNA polymerase III epsilon subunit-like protein
LKNSFKKVGLPWQNLNFKCSYELAKLDFQDLPSYSLKTLSKYLNLKVNQHFFNPSLAHTARYDAEFTYQLYLKIMTKTPKSSLLDSLRDKPNPFSSSRVDNPFQDHIDLKAIYQDEFDTKLRSNVVDLQECMILEKSSKTKPSWRVR